MKKFLTPFVAVLCMAIAFTSCKKDAKVLKADQVSESALAQIKALGFSTQNAQKVPQGYLVEGDIILTDADLRAGAPTSPEMVIAQEEHYRTNNLVNTSTYPTIKVALSLSSSTYTAAFTAALDEAIRRYNAQNLAVRFQRVTSGANITIVGFYEVSNTLGSSGFPSGGAPYSQIQMNTYWYSTSTSSTNVNYIGTIMAHEMGHCIGFRHTDYMNRSYSCGGSAVNEGSAGIGAVLIPGTPSGPSANSWMLACVGSNVSRPFTSSDITALTYVY